ncbi:HepT-like ribonuclease domain-containing protein [Hydrogenobacter thermophilus]|nr:DUF86 domain-containing protein [Hydrogenobacter thermophilus]
MLFACNKIMNYTKGLTYEDFKKNEMVIDAVTRNIEILGEASKSISDGLKNKYPEVGWKEIARTRDKIIHFYFGINLEIIWDIVIEDIPKLKTELEKIIKLEGWSL